MSDPNANRRRRHKAAGGRVAATGAGAGALLAIVGGIAAHSSPATTTAAPKANLPTVPARPGVPHPAPRIFATPTTILWRVVHRVVVVTDPPVGRATGSNGGGSAHPNVYSTVPNPAPAGTGAPPAPAPPPSPPPPVPAPAPVPACSGTKCP